MGKIRNSISEKIKFQIFIIISIIGMSLFAQDKHLIRGQSLEFPLYTELDSAVVYAKLDRMIKPSSSLSMKNVDSLLTLIEPFLKKKNLLNDFLMLIDFQYVFLQKSVYGYY